MSLGFDYIQDFEGVSLKLSLPSWAKDVAIVTVIFAAGGAYVELKLKVSQLESDVLTLEKSNKNMTNVIIAQYGVDWQKNISEITNVDSWKSEVNSSIDGLDPKISANTKLIDWNSSWVTSIQNWAVQQDALIRSSTLDKFRAIAVYSKSKSLETFEIRVNKQHVKGAFYKLGDKVLIENPHPPARQVEVIVQGFINDPANSNVLVQVNESLLSELGLTTLSGRYELFVTNDPDVLRWKSLKNLRKEQMFGKNN
ncbi:hypothetical protein [Vibrio sp. 10N.222.46.A1]|uniref:Uncharacterized protein n=1 Tax=Vibrio tasmaniensis TaxID=212663 RepID=A0A2N7NGT6_9VIBR|nr:hypothetical protein BCS92_17070 [Vibrio tasmaniensis]